MYVFFIFIHSAYKTREIEVQKTTDAYKLSFHTPDTVECNQLITSVLSMSTSLGLHLAAVIQEMILTSRPACLYV